MESAKAIEDLVRQIHIMTDDTKAATLKSQSIVEDQQTQVEATKQMFLDMNLQCIMKYHLWQTILYHYLS